MNANDVKRTLEAQGVRADAVHIEATAATVSALLNGAGERFSQLPLEAEPSGFQAAQRSRAA
jgi:hypothetical protein